MSRVTQDPRVSSDSLSPRRMRLSARAEGAQRPAQHWQPPLRSGSKRASVPRKTRQGQHTNRQD
eukprot:2887870-Rhodomonas_salina.2